VSRGRPETKRAYNAAYHAAHREEANATSRAWGETHPDEKRAYNRTYYLAHQAEGIENQRAWREAHPYAGMTDERREKHRLVQADQRLRHPDRVGARTALVHAIKKGLLARGPCAECGAVPAHGHHHRGYEPDFWLDVIWLCRTHHGKAHRMVVVA